MKQWPDDKTPDFEDLIEPLHHAVFWALAVDAGVIADDFDYSGYDTPSTAAICLPPDEALTIKCIEHHDQTALETVLGIVFRLGYEQGKRVDKYTKLLAELATKYIGGERGVFDKSKLAELE